MRLGEECPYVTPCGWCSRQNKPCEERERKLRQMEKRGLGIAEQMKKRKEAQ